MKRRDLFKAIGAVIVGATTQKAVPSDKDLDEICAEVPVCSGECNNCYTYYTSGPNTFVWSRQLTPTEIEQLHSNPYAMFTTETLG